MAAGLLQQWRLTKDSLQKLHGDYAALQRVEQIVTKQCKRMLRAI